MIVLAVLIFKPWKIVVEPTQEAEAVQNLLAVMYFDNLADPEDAGRLGEIAANLLITDLSESKYVQVVSSQRLFDLLNLIGHTGDKRIDRVTASEVARKANARWMLMGSLLKIEPNIVLTAQLVEVETGNAVASQRINGAPGEDIFALVDRLTVEVKNDLSLPAESGTESDLVIADGTTHSTEAYRYYLSGIEKANKFYWSEAEQDFRKAIELDSTFAMAYFYLLWSEKGTRAEHEEWSAIALRHSEGIPQKDRMYIESAAKLVASDNAGVIATLEQLVASFPDEKFALLGLAYSYRYGKQYEKAIVALQRVVTVDPAYGLAYNLMAYTYDAMGDFDNSITAINKYIELAPDEANPYDTRGDLYAYNGKLEQGIASYREALARKPDFFASLGKIGQVALLLRDYELADSCFAVMSAADIDETRSIGRANLALIPAYQGRYTDALRVLDEGLAADRLEQFDEDPVLLKVWIKSTLLSNLGRFQETVAICEEYDPQQRRVLPSDIAGLRFWISINYAMLGEFDTADSILSATYEEIMSKDSTQADGYWWALAEVSLARGDAAGALEALRNSTNSKRDFWTKRTKVRAHLALGQPAEAIAILESYVGRFEDGGVTDPGLIIGAHYFLGQAYEQSGWTDKAIEKYELFLDIWKDADPEIVMVQDAKKRLARLKAGS
jgi:tetratricopeptide (TPR) repeat protein/TolB-like protein